MISHSKCALLQYANQVLPFIQTETSVQAKFLPLKNSLYSTVCVSVLGGILFLLCSNFIINDKSRAEELTKLNELGVMEAVEENIQVAQDERNWMSS